MGVWWASSGWKVSRTRALPEKSGTALRIQAARNEAEAAQLVLRPKRDLSGFRATAGDLQGPNGATGLDPIGVTWPSDATWQGGVRTRAEHHQGEGALLVADNNPHDNVSVHLIKPVEIPRDGVRLRFWYKTATPGQRFNVTINHYDAAGQWMSGRNDDIPLTCDGTWQAFDRRFEQFPDGARSVSLSLWGAQWTESGDTTGSVYYDELALENAGNGEALARGDFEPPTAEQLTPVFDWAAWDAAMERGINQYHFNSISIPIPGLGGGTFYSRSDPSLLGYAEDTPEYKTRLRITAVRWRNICARRAG
jgi:hypothetical protein